MKDITFLIVDDCQTVRSVVRSAIFNRIGSNKIYTANNGAQALEILANRKIDIVISDWEMPKVNGQQLLAKIRCHDRLKDMPFIMMTSRGGRESVLTAIQNGVSHYIVKPFTTEKLEDAVRKSWNSASKRHAIRLSGLPEHTLELELKGKSFSGQVRNISHTGAMIELPFDDSLALFSQCHMHLQVTLIEEAPIDIKHLSGTIVRLEAEDAYDPENTGCRIALHFDQELLKNTVEKQLNDLIDKLSANVPKIIQDLEN